MKYAGNVTLDCPMCSVLGLAAQQNEDRFDGRQWQREREYDECAACKRKMNAEAFKSDESGVMTVKHWECYQCKADNIALRFHCLNCGASV